MSSPSRSRSTFTPFPSKYLRLIAPLEQHHRETITHSKRVAALSLRLGQFMGLSLTELHFLRIGAELHDIGKQHIPESILNCPHSLSNKDFSVMRLHPAYGGEMAEALRCDERVVAAIRFHHERFDGSGYPSGLVGTEIPLTARIVTLVDAYDTMISRRAYQPFPRRIADAMREIERCAGQQFDPDIAALFLNQLNRRYQPSFPL